ncbi:MAG: S9 family peptidase [Bryobacterales bacterium]|nr:S9 family peptidase [Bryobacterales bacterium]
MRRIALLAAILVLPLGAQKQPFDANALLRLSRISDPQLSPDGRTVVFVVQTMDLANQARPRQIYSIPLVGGVPRQLTRDGNNDRPRWTPDSKTIAFVSDRGGGSQIWMMDALGDNQRQFTNIATEAGGVMVSPTGTHVLFTSDVYPQCASAECNQRELEAEKNDKVKAREYTSLLYRRWNQWRGKRRTHLFVMPASGGDPRDLTPGPRDVPPFSLGGPDDYAISPDGKEVCYVAVNSDQPATSTNTDIYVVPIDGGEATQITVNPGADSSPQYSPDGRYLAYRSQFRAGYESDRWRLLVLERATGTLTNLTEGLDRWVTGFRWSPESQRLFFTVEDRGRQSIQYVPVGGGGARVAVTGDSTLDDMQFTADGRTMIYTAQSGRSPVEIFRASSGGGMAEPLARLNDTVMNGHHVSDYEEFWVEGADGARVHGFLLKPPNFDPGKRYPALLLIHGGPQGAWSHAWSYRWNAQVFAGAGFVVAMANPRGSTGFGQKYIDEINRDWGGKVYDDILAVTDHLAGQRFVDPDRIAAAGASYGGYMVNWILGQTDRFRALVSHAGVFDLRSEALETEELFFPIWEFGGMPWEQPEIYDRFSPSRHIQNFKTPTLVIHGDLDYRVPVGQGLQLFTALQMREVPSKLLLFPDEGHWILKPINSLRWYNTFLNWIQEWTTAR